MSDETKEKNFEFPMMPIFGLDLGRELGSLDSRLARVENDVQKLDARLDRLDAKIDTVEARLTDKINTTEAKLSNTINTVDSRVDKCLVAVNRLDERTKTLTILCGGILVAVLGGFILQYLQ